jgi:hypothetical protein
VLAGDVELLADGTAKVASQSNGTTAYHVVNGHCDCKDFPKAPHSFCKHRLSAAIARRAHELVQQRLSQLDNATNGPVSSDQPQGEATPALPLPEAPVSITLKATLHGHEVMVTLRGVDFRQCQGAGRASVTVAQRPDPTAATCPTHDATRPRRQPLLPSAQDGHEALLEGWPLLVLAQDGGWPVVQRPVTSIWGRVHTLPHSRREDVP